jgi:hypothetical protein
MTNICPICNCELKEEERLVLEYYPPKDWWVTRHLRKRREDEEAIVTRYSGFTERCAWANLQRPDWSIGRNDLEQFAIQIAQGQTEAIVEKAKSLLNKLGLPI